MTKEDYIRLIILALALLGIQASPELTQMITDLVNLAYENSMPTELNDNGYFVSKVVGAATLIGVWIWRTAINYDRYMTLRREVQELKDAHYITIEDLRQFKQNCRTEVKLNQNVALDDLFRLVDTLIAKVDMLLQERNIEFNDRTAHRRRRTDYPSNLSVRANEINGVP